MELWLGGILLIILKLRTFLKGPNVIKTFRDCIPKTILNSTQTQPEHTFERLTHLWPW